MADDVKLEITAEDRSGPAFDSANRRIRETSQRAREGAQSYESFARGLTAASNAVQRGMSLMTRLDLTQLTLEAATNRAADAQTKLTAATKEFGAGSPQAIAASRELESANSNLEKTNLRAKLSYALVTGDLLIMAAKVPILTAQLRTYTLAQTGATAAALRFATTLGTVAAAAGLAIAGKSLVDNLLGTDAVFKIRDTEERLAALKEERDGLLAQATRPILGPVIEDVAGKVPGIETAEERLQRVNDAILEAEGEVNAVRDFNRKQNEMKSKEAADKEAAIQQEAADKIANAWEQSIQQTSGYVQNLGVDLGRLGPAALDALGTLSPQLAELAARTDTAAQMEEELATKILASTNPALREQLSVTRQKGETTDDFRKRLVALGYKEEELAGKLDDTTESFSLQTQATQQAAAAIGGGPASSTTEAYGSPAVTRKGMTTGGGDAGSLLDAVYAMMNRGLGGADAEMARRSLEHIIRGGGGGMGLGNIFLQRALGSLGVIRAADGFDGMVSGPQLFLAGEAGREHVNIQPGGRGGLQMGNVSLTAVVNGNAKEADIRRGMMSALKQFTIVQKRIASRRSY